MTLHQCGLDAAASPGPAGGRQALGSKPGQWYQFGQEGLRRITTVRSALSCTDSRGERSKSSQQCEVPQVQVAVSDPDQAGPVTAGRLPGVVG